MKALQNPNVLKQSRENGRLLDFGCGSGILGVAVKKIYPKWNFDFVDIEEQALIETKYHHEYNNLDLENSRMQLGSDFIFEPQTYNIIMANILLNTILEFLPQLLFSLRSNGVIIFSGILVAQQDELVASVKVLAPNCGITHEEKDGWVCLMVVL